MYDTKTDTWSVIATNEEMTHLINFSAVNYGNAAIFAFGDIGMAPVWLRVLLGMLYLLGWV